ncbi:guanylate kinase [Helicobacter sp. 23-1048]
MSALLILSGPSGCGKSTLSAEILAKIPNAYFSISTTTRAKRESEQDGVHYHFVSEEEFLTHIKEGKFLEYAQVHNNYYGTSLLPITQALEQGRLVVFDVDVQGHTSIKKHFGNAVKSVFITTKNAEILKSRLQMRNTDDEATIKLRLAQAKSEMQHLGEFDFVIINDDINEAREAIVCIAKSLFYANSDKNSSLAKNWHYI